MGDRLIRVAQGLSNCIWLRATTARRSSGAVRPIANPRRAQFLAEKRTYICTVPTPFGGSAVGTRGMTIALDAEIINGPARSEREADVDAW